MDRDLGTLLLLVHAITTWFLVGLIWFVQIVHYPLFAAVGDGAARTYAAAHQRRTSTVVVAPMILEALCAIAVALRAAVFGPFLVAAGLLLLVLIWVSTFALQVPLHNARARRLSAGDRSGTVRALVATNWIRTAGWSLRGLVAAALLWRWLEHAPAG